MSYSAVYDSSRDAQRKSHDLAIQLSYQYFLILITITTTSALLCVPYPSHPHPITPHGGEVVPQATLENV